MNRDSLASRLCIGEVYHFRRAPRPHRFRVPLYMVYLDLDEIELLQSQRVLGRHRFAAASFHREDHLHASSDELSRAVRALVVDRTGLSVNGPIRLLTQLRLFGYYFSPLNVYYCFDTDGRTLQCAVAEVSNTPWGEQHCYVLWEGNRVDHAHSARRYQHAKEFHVSPFLDMQQAYNWKLAGPGDELDVEIQNTPLGDKPSAPVAPNSENAASTWSKAGTAVDSQKVLFSAGMTLRAHPLTRSSLRRAQLRFPFMTAQISAAIYFQALRLWWKRTPFVPHPSKTLQPVEATLHEY